MKTSNLIEGQKYLIAEKGQATTYRYNGKDGGGKFVFVKCEGFGMRVYAKNIIEIPNLVIHEN